LKLTLDDLWMHVDAVGDCMLWKYSVTSSGYPQAYLKGKPGASVRKHVYTSLLGKPVPNGKVMTNLCGNKRCISPDCLSVATKSRVQKLAYRTGKRNPAVEYLGRYKAALAGGLVLVTPEQLEAIRAQPIERTHTEIAREMNLGEKCVSRIRRGVSHKQGMPSSSVFAWRP